MRSPRRRRAVALALAPLGLLAHLVLTASPAAAHGGGAGSLPAPPWLLAYIGAFVVALTAVAMRASWATQRLQLPREATPDDAGAPGARVGQLAGLVVYLTVTGIALLAPDDTGVNIAPYAVFVIWWIGVPMLCLLFGDVVRPVNPFLGALGLVDRLRGARTSPADRVAPAWTGAAFLAAFTWFPLSFHDADSARLTGVLMCVYGIGAVAGGVVWGRAWLETGEGFGAMSRAVSQVSLRRRRPAPAAAGVLALTVVWIGGTLFDALSATTFWVDVLGTTDGWSRTALNTVGQVWMTAVVGAVSLAVLRVAGSSTDAAVADDDERGAAAVLRVVGLALVPIAVAWFLAHDLAYFLFESQNFRALASDPFGRGWDLFGTYYDIPNYSIVTSKWVGWTQVAMLLVAHVGAVVIAHDVALAELGRRKGMRVTWVVASAIAVSAVGAALMVIE